LSNQSSETFPDIIIDVVASKLGFGDMHT